MSVREYYCLHFNELSPEKQFHFATRMKNFFKSHDFDEYLMNNKLSQDLEPLFQRNNYTDVLNYEMRKPFFEKYPELYGVEAALFRVHHLMKEYGIDIRDGFMKLYPEKKLGRLVEILIDDEDALRALSTWAVNTIFLTKELFPGVNDATNKLTDWALRLDSDMMDPTLFVYLCTHVIICRSEYYTKKIENAENLARLLKKCERVVLDNIDTISLDAALEYLVCCKMTGVECEEIEEKIAAICEEYREDKPYLINYRRDKAPGSYYHTLDGAEHANTLYIMSGLDKD